MNPRLANMILLLTDFELDLLIDTLESGRLAEALEEEQRQRRAVRDRLVGKADRAEGVGR